ncbi:hypothetical protein F5X99DRAFT_412798 [Biscogniauxia marginata]|nr:hypothetical protein F5X99DRAFT_412798 [Biscogniauxia marginata]
MITKDLEHGILTRAKVLEDQFVATIETAVGFAVDIRESLDDIRNNTKKLFFWTSTIIVILLGLFILDQIVKLRRQLTTLNQFQSAFHQMWHEDREDERRVRIQQRRERLLDELNGAIPNPGAGLPFSLEEINAALDTAPPVGTVEWHQFVRDVQNMALQFQAQHGH